MPAVKDVGEPCAREPHARFEVAAGGNQASRASTCRTVQAPPADPTVRPLVIAERRNDREPSARALLSSGAEGESRVSNRTVGAR